MTFTFPNTNVPRPEHYPRSANSGIADAQAFRIGSSEVIHSSARFPDGNKVTAKCGAYGYATERDSRIATWSADAPNCPRCKR